MLWERDERREEAECLGSSYELFHPDIVDEDGVEWFDDGTIVKAFGPTDEYYAEGKLVCGVCSVRDQCLEFALKNRIRFGLYGGHDPLERRRIERRERRRRRQLRLHLESLGISDDFEDDEYDGDDD